MAHKNESADINLDLVLNLGVRIGVRIGYRLRIYPSHTNSNATSP